MHSLAWAVRDSSSQGFAIQTEQTFARLGLGMAGRLGKGPAEHLLDFARINRLPQHVTPRTVMRHTFSFQRKELAQFLGTQFGPMSHDQATLIAG